MVYQHNTITCSSRPTSTSIMNVRLTRHMRNTIRATIYQSTQCVLYRHDGKGRNQRRLSAAPTVPRHPSLSSDTLLHLDHSQQHRIQHLLDRDLLVLYRKTLLRTFMHPSPSALSPSNTSCATSYTQPKSKCERKV